MSPQSAPRPDEFSAPARPKSRRWLRLGAIGATLAIAAGAWWYFRIPSIDAVVVHPFADQTGSAWLAGAITEEIVETLRPVTKVEAAPRHMAVLDGTVARAGDRLRVTATLSSLGGHRYWTKTFERPAADLAADIAAAIAPRIRKQSVRHKPIAPAYEQYLEARQQFGASEFARAAAGFERAAGTDPEFGLAWAWLAIADEHLADRGAARPNDLGPAARDAAERAVTLEPNLADSHTALGMVKLLYDWDWFGARREFDRALQLSPLDPLANRWSRRWTEATQGGAPAPAIDLPSVPRDPEAARQLLAEADTLREQSYIPAATLVLAASVAHDSDSLFRWLDAAYEERSAQLPYLLHSPALPLSDPRVAEFARRLKLPNTTP